MVEYPVDEILWIFVTPAQRFLWFFENIPSYNYRGNSVTIHTINGVKKRGEGKGKKKKKKRRKEEKERYVLY